MRVSSEPVKVDRKFQRIFEFFIHKTDHFPAQIISSFQPLRAILDVTLVRSIGADKIGWQHPFDRILHIELSKKEGSFTIIIELFKNGNILLVNQENNILIPLKRQQWTHRMIQIGKPYTPPPTQINPFDLKQETFQNLLNTSTVDIVRTLAVELNFGGLYAEEICLRAKIEKTVKSNTIHQENQLHLF